MKWPVIMVLLSATVIAACVEPMDSMVINKDMVMCSSTYDVPNGINIGASDIVVDCGTAVLRGTKGRSEIGIKVENVTNVTIRNCNIVTFDQGLFLINVTNSLIEHNAFLKNRIGVRMLDSFENVIRDNNDKSFQLAVSAIHSKFNIVMLNNKNIERAFCEVNACNEFRDMNPCESGDGYCSKRCTPQTDADCAPPVVEQAMQKENVSIEKHVEELARQAEKEVEQKGEKPKVTEAKKKIPVGTKILIYLTLYIITFVVLRVLKKKR